MPTSARRSERRRSLLLEKLIERLAFERACALLYAGLIEKHQAAGAFAGGPTEEDLLHIGSEESEHVKLLEQLLARAGGDVAAVQPSATVSTRIIEALSEVLRDPDTDLRQSLDAMLFAELANTEGWRTLQTIARQAGHEVESGCREAIAHERAHLTRIRRWITAGEARDVTDRAPMPEAASAAQQAMASHRAGSEILRAGRP
jgi:rubrerythrin